LPHRFYYKWSCNISFYVSNILELHSVVWVEVYKQCWNDYSFHYRTNQDFCCDQTSQVRAIFEKYFNFLSSLTHSVDFINSFLYNQVKIFSFVIILNCTVNFFVLFIVNVKYDSKSIKFSIKITSFEGDIEKLTFVQYHRFFEKCNFLSTYMVFFFI